MPASHVSREYSSVSKRCEVASQARMSPTIPARDRIPRFPVENVQANGGVDRYFAHDGAHRQA
jgi:hypothetical protein